MDGSPTVRNIGNVGASQVKVAYPTAVSPGRIRSLLRVDPLPVEHVTSPSIMVDGRFHTAACRWLRRKYLIRPVDATVRSNASRLAGYISYLRNERGLNHPDERQADVFAAGEDDVRAFYRSRQFTPQTAVSSSAWAAQLSTLKQFHEFLRATYGIQVPFRLVTFTNPAGYAGTTAPDYRPRTRVASSGMPVTPGFAELLIQGAYRINSYDGWPPVGTAMSRRPRIRPQYHQGAAPVEGWRVCCESWGELGVVVCLGWLVLWCEGCGGAVSRLGVGYVSARRGLGGGFGSGVVVSVFGADRSAVSMACIEAISSLATRSLRSRVLSNHGW